MYRKVASYLTIMGISTAISGAILGGIGCKKETDSGAIAPGADVGEPAPDLGAGPNGVSDASLVLAVQYVSGELGEGESIDQAAIDAVEVMWRVASVTTDEAAAAAFAGSQGKDGAALGVESQPPEYSDCEAAGAEPEAINDILPVLFQHRPGVEAVAEWRRLRAQVSGGDLVKVTCADAPPMVVAIAEGRVVAARETLELSDEPEMLEPTQETGEPLEDPSVVESELVDSLPELPEPGKRPRADLEITSLVDGATVVIDGTEASLPHQMTAIDSSKTLHFKVKAPGHLDSEVGALPMDVFTMLQGGEPQASFHWVVWPHPAR